MTLFFIVTLNGLSLAALYFIAASGFSLVFGVMRVVNMAHGSLILLGAYVAFDVAEWSGSWVFGALAGSLAAALAGVLLQVLFFNRMAGKDLQQTLVSIAVSIIAADLMLAHWGGLTYQLNLPSLLEGSIGLPLLGVNYAKIRIVLIVAAIAVGVGLWLLMAKTNLGRLIRAGVDDQEMLHALGFNVKGLFIAVFALGGALAGFAGVVAATALSVSPGTDVQFLLAALIVVIVGGMGSIRGAAIGAVLVGLSEQYGLVYAPTYGVVFTFIIMIGVLGFRPQGLFGRGDVG